MCDRPFLFALFFTSIVSDTVTLEKMDVLIVFSCAVLSLSVYQ